MKKDLLADMGAFFVSYRSLSATHNNLLLSIMPQGITEQIATEVIKIFGAFFMSFVTHLAVKLLTNVTEKNKVEIVPPPPPAITTDGPPENKE